MMNGATLIGKGSKKIIVNILTNIDLDGQWGWYNVHDVKIFIFCREYGVLVE